MRFTASARRTPWFANGRTSEPAPGNPRTSATTSAYLFGAVAPAQARGVALVMPKANTHAMQAHLEEIARMVAPGAHAIVLLDQAGWHITEKLKPPTNISLLPLPPGSPELNPVENIWQYLRQSYLSNRVFDGYDAILDAAPLS